MKKEEKGVNPKQRKHLASVTALVMALALLLTGTLAWYSTADKINIFINEGAEKSVVLHDDFEGGIDKHVYVENTSPNIDLYVRIKLQEFMDLTTHNERVVSSSEWMTHTPNVAVEDCGNSNKLSEQFHNYFEWTMGGSKYYLSNEEGVNGNALSDLGDYSPSGAAYLALELEQQTKVKQTLVASIISMPEYSILDDDAKIAYIGWVYDNDGWIYWSQPLAAGEATGLLLNKVNPINGVEEKDYYYAINVTMEAVNKSDLPMWVEASGNNDGLGQPSVIDGEQTELATSEAMGMLGFISEIIDEEIDEEKEEELNILSILEVKSSKTFHKLGGYLDPNDFYDMTLRVGDVWMTSQEVVIPSGFDVSIKANQPSVLGPLDMSLDEVYFTYKGYKKSDFLMITDLLERSTYDIGSLTNLLKHPLLDKNGDTEMKFEIINKYSDKTGDYLLLLSTANLNPRYYDGNYTYSVVNGNMCWSLFSSAAFGWIAHLIVVMPDLSSAMSKPTPTTFLWEDPVNGYSNGWLSLDMSVFSLSKEESEAYSGTYETDSFWTRTSGPNDTAYVYNSTTKQTELVPKSNNYGGRYAFWVKVPYNK